MAPKRPLPSENPPPASSDDESFVASDDEEEEEEERRESGESSSESESDDGDGKEEQKKPSQPKPSPPPPQPQPQPQPKSQGESDSGSESESDSGSESESRRYTVKPIASKPMENNETPPAKKQKPEPSSSSKLPAAKRKGEMEDSKDSKKGKKKDVAENGSLQKSGEESKKPTFQRLWGDNDEIALLQGLIDFREKKGMDPTANTNAFHHFVKKFLGQEFTDSQLANKIRVLKKKYKNNEGKGKDGEDRAFSKPREQKIFEMSKKIWGLNKSSNAGGSGEQTPIPKANGTAKKSKTAGTSSKLKLEASKSEKSQERPKENGGLIPFEHSDAVGMLSCDKMLQISKIGLDEDFLKKGLEMVDELKREDLKEKWRKLQLAEMRVLAERAALIQYQTNLILEAYHQANGK